MDINIRTAFAADLMTIPFFLLLYEMKIHCCLSQALRIYRFVRTASILDIPAIMIVRKKCSSGNN